MAHQTRFQQERVEHMQNNPYSVDEYTRQMYGMGAAEMELALLGLVEVSKGHMPSGPSRKYIEASAKATFGWSADRTRKELEKVINSSTLPEARIHAYLGANGRQVTGEMLQHAVGMVSAAAHADLEVALEDRLDAGNHNHKLPNEFEGMKGDPRAIRDSNDRNDIRNLIRLKMGDKLPSQKTLADRQEDVMRSRHEVGDRLEMFAKKHGDDNPPSLRDSLKMNYEVAAVNEASKDVGLGDPIGNAKEDNEERWGHLDESHDPLERLEDR